MEYSLPHTIDSGRGEKLVFKELVHEPDGDRLIVEGSCAPNAGPPMHVHFKQDESISVVKGKLGYQINGKEPVYLNPGESIIFKRGEAHRFWNAGEDELQLNGWVKPANSIVFFLSTMYDALRNSKSERPEPFDSAYLMTKYKNEYDMIGLPGFVKKVIIPITYQVGKIRGKYKKFRDAPKPL